MVLTLLCARRRFCAPDPEYRRDTGELLLEAQRASAAGNLPSLVHALHKGALEISQPLYPDQIARMDPILRSHLRVGPAGRRSEPPA